MGAECFKEQGIIGWVEAFEVKRIGGPLAQPLSGSMGLEKGSYFESHFQQVLNRDTIIEFINFFRVSMR